MHNNLYCRLLRYQSTAKQSQLENFCTEGFCDLLSRMDSKQQRIFFSKLLGCWTHGYLLWKTQVPIKGITNVTTFPDIMGYENGKPTVIIEVKIGADQTSSQVEENGNTETISQLELYGRWLAQHNSKGQLLYLTHSTSPSENFSTTEGDTFYGVTSRKHITWQKVYDCLDGVENFLGKDFKNFLCNRKLAVEPVTRHDFLALENYVAGPVNRIVGLMAPIRPKLEKLYQNKGFHWGYDKNNLSRGFVIHLDHPVAWSWVYREKGYEALTWGFLFPQQTTSELNLRRCFPSLQNRPYLFLAASTRSMTYHKQLKMLCPNSWMKNEFSAPDRSSEVFSILTATPLDDILASEFPVIEIEKWIDERFAEGTEIFCNADIQIKK